MGCGIGDMGYEGEGIAKKNTVLESQLSLVDFVQAQSKRFISCPKKF